MNSTDKKSFITEKFLPLLVIGILAIAVLFLWTSYYSWNEPYSDLAEGVSVPSADFIFEIDPGGDVYVTEKWKIDYTGGQKQDGFYREYEMLDEWSDLDISSLKISIDGRPCKKYSDLDMYDQYELDELEYLYDIRQNMYHEDNYYLYCYKTSRNVTRDLVISYTLHGAVMNVEEFHHLLLYILKPDPYSIDKLTFKIITPEGSQPVIKNGKTFGLFKSVTTEKNTVKMIGRTACSEDFKLKVRIDHANIEGTIPVKADGLTEVDDMGVGSVISALYLLGQMVGIPIVIAMIATEYIKKHYDIDMDILPHGLRQCDLIMIPALGGLRGWLNFAGVMQIFLGFFFMVASDMVEEALWERGYSLPKFVILLCLAGIVATGITLIARKTVLHAILVAVTAIFLPHFFGVPAALISICCAIILERFWRDYKAVKG